MAIVISSGSSFTSSTFAVATSSQGKYKITADNKLRLYDITGGRYEEKVDYDNLYKMIEKTYDMPNIIVEDREFVYTVEGVAGERILTLDPVVEVIDKLGFGMLTADDPFTISK